MTLCSSDVTSVHHTLLLFITLYQPRLCLISQYRRSLNIDLSISVVCLPSDFLGISPNVTKSLVSASVGRFAQRLPVASVRRIQVCRVGMKTRCQVMLSCVWLQGFCCLFFASAALFFNPLRTNAAGGVHLMNLINERLPYLALLLDRLFKRHRMINSG